MHENARIRSQAQRCLDQGGPTIVIGRTDRFSGSQLAAPQINGLATFASSHDDREGKALEEKLVHDAFQAFTQEYRRGLERLLVAEEAVV